MPLPGGIVYIEVEFDPQRLKNVLEARPETRTTGWKMEIRQERATFEIGVHLRWLLRIKLGRKAQSVREFIPVRVHVEVRGWAILAATPQILNTEKRV